MLAFVLLKRLLLHESLTTDAAFKRRWTLQSLRSLRSTSLQHGAVYDQLSGLA